MNQKKRKKEVQRKSSKGCKARNQPRDKIESFQVKSNQ